MKPRSSESAGRAEARPKPLRQQQLELTRSRIVTALAELIETEHPLDVTMASVAATAGVSEPTLYRHFPTKRQLFAALGTELYRQSTQGVAPASVDDLVEFLPTLYEMFGAMEGVIRWNLAAPRNEVVRARAEERLPILRRALASTLEGLPEADAKHLLRGLLLLTSPTSALYLQDYLDISAEEAAETAGWLVRRLAKE